MTIARSVLLFVLAAVAEVGGGMARLARRSRDKGIAFIAAGIVALDAYRVRRHAATGLQLRPDSRRLRRDLRRRPPAVGLVVDGFRPDRFDLWGAGICLVGVAIIVYAPRAGALEG